MPREQAQTVAIPHRVPLVVTPENRDNTTAKDARLVNAYMEKNEQGDFFIYRRPGMSYNSRPSGGSGAGYGTFQWLGDIYAVVGTTLYKNNSSLGTVDGTGGVYRFGIIPAGTPYLILGNGVAAYYVKAGVLTQLGGRSSVTMTGNTVSGAATVTNMSSQVGVHVGDSFQDTLGSTIIPYGATVKTIDSGTQITLTANALSNSTAATFTDTVYGIYTPFVKGWAYLDQTTYMASLPNYVNGSNLNDPTTWNPLNQLTAQIEPDYVVGVDKQMVYVIVFKQWSTEVFYDEANSTGSPLGPVQGAKVNYGCQTIESVQNIEGSLMWLATSRSGSRSVLQLDSLNARQISSKPIDRLLQYATFNALYSWQCKIDGHKFYVLTLKDQNLTLAYDIVEQAWSQWTDINGNYLPVVCSTVNSAGQTIVQHESNGKLYLFESTNYNDDGVAIQVDVYTPSWDGGTSRRKHMGRLFIKADQQPGSLSIRCSDDDYRTWSNFRTVDLGTRRPYLDNCGTFTKRAYNLRYSASTPFRMMALEPQIDIGTL